METFVGDTVKINLLTGIDISGYATLLMFYRKPNGITGCWTASVCAANNKCMTYTTLTTDLDVSGTWYIQAYVEGSALHGMWATFTVYDPLLLTCTSLAPTTVAPTTAP